MRSARYLLIPLIPLIPTLARALLLRQPPLIDRCFSVKCTRLIDLCMYTWPTNHLLQPRPVRRPCPPASHQHQPS
ncbi:hypothetical protein F4859DRAFT_304174 [Xylaria cf. heliscus]|nr:hypothetical protein F4859DRAFT_304174 [Xylaria cf. heliscus]